MPDGGLDGIRVALLEARMAGELGDFVRRRGGLPVCVPAVKEVAVDCRVQVAAFIDAHEARAAPGTGHVVIFLTAVGANALFLEAERQGRLPALVRALTLDVVVCRGPKPSGVLRRYGISLGPHVPEPYTSAALMQALEQIDLDGTGVTLVHYGERSASLADQLIARGAVLDELCLYEWQLPDDVEPLRKMVQDLIRGDFDALVFTSQIQCRHLFQIAADMQMDTRLAEALRSRVVVAAIGPTCQAAVEEYGVTPQIVPHPPKMAPLVASLASYFAERGTRQDRPS
jgi:uroporphyrinogen-III synthase